MQEKHMEIIAKKYGFDFAGDIGTLMEVFDKLEVDIDTVQDLECVESTYDKLIINAKREDKSVRIAVTKTFCSVKGDVVAFSGKTLKELKKTGLFIVQKQDEKVK